MRSPASLEALFAGAEGRDVTVIHCAGIVSIASRFDQNVYCEMQIPSISL